jgi:carboxypeptidase T
MAPRRVHTHPGLALLVMAISAVAPPAFSLALTLVGTLSPHDARAAGLAGVPERAFYRIDVRHTKNLRPLLELGLDIAGKGPGETLDLILDSSEVLRVRALGFEPVRIGLGTGPNAAAQSPSLDPSLGNYHTVAEAAAEMAAYASAHPTIARLDTIGFSFEGRPILAMRVTDNVGVEEGEPEFLVVGCHHARELMSVELPLYLMRRLLNGYGSDPVITGLVNSRSVWIVPILNPDGHVFVENNSGSFPTFWWRKNRRPDPVHGTIGVDLNRNYGYKWGWDNVGSSSLSSSEVYRGTGPFSETETSALRDFIASRSFTIAASIHSFGELFLYPWGYDALDTPDQATFQAIGDSVSIQNGYLAGNPKSGAIYLTNGEFDDWVYGDTVTKPGLFGFTFEVNTEAQGGFAPSDALIGPTCDLNWGPLLTLLRYADRPRRILSPVRPATPWFTATSSGVDLRWVASAPDPGNPPVRHDVRRVSSITVGTDDAEAGVAAWDSILFSWSAARRWSGTRSFWSGSGDSRTSVLTSAAAVNAAVGESLVVMAFWELETDLDYWYAEASMDSGSTWRSLRGDRTTTLDPYGKNQGNGVTDWSGGVFLRTAFAWGPVGGHEVHVRFRCVTDSAAAGEGLYLDDITPTAMLSGVVESNTGSPETRFALTPPPGSVAWFQVRAIDAEGQRSPWSVLARYEPSVSAVAGDPGPPTADRLAQNVPNPFNPRTEIRFSLGRGKPGAYRVAVYDAAGRRVAILVSGWDPGAGANLVARWDGIDGAGRPAGSGVYLLRLDSARGITSRKMTLLR